jgi:general L-amino acid transport system permease protein
MSSMGDEYDVSFVREEMLEALPPSAADSGVILWLRKNLFSSWTNTIATLIILYLLYLIIPPFIEFVLTNAVWSGTGRDVCSTEAQGGVQPNGWFGACWAYVGAYFNQFIYGRYPVAERWRVDIVFLLFFGGLIPLVIPRVPYKTINVVFMLLVFPIAAFILLTGGHISYTGFLIPDSWMAPSLLRFVIEYLVLTAIIMAIAYAFERGSDRDPRPTLITTAGIMAGIAVILFIFGIDFGLPFVETSYWGGLLVTLVIAVTGIVASLPLGILLALGRRSNLPVVRLFSVIFIEFWRGVPLITVLFMASVMLPLFLPEGVDFDKLFRALVGVALFAAAYMAETIRGGLQAIPKGQYEGAMAVGLSYWQMMGMIILPQALKIVIPGIVNIFIGLFKDTTLVLIIGLFDFLGQIQSSYSDSTWVSPVQVMTGYTFAVAIYFIFCFGMGQYSRYMERRLHTGH